MKPPKEERIKYSVDYDKDTDFAANARLLQSKWRELKGYPFSKYGSLLETEFAMASKANFLTDGIRKLVTLKVAESKSNGELISEPRIWNNLLSSQPLCFNLFGDIALDLRLASEFFRLLFPDRVKVVNAIRFEYSPGRRDGKYLGDKSAFDVFVEYERESIKGFLGIEIKYSECLREESSSQALKNYKERYSELTRTSGKFKPDSVSALKLPPLSQIWRDHLLSIAMEHDYDEGQFVFLFPSKNTLCHRGVDLYKKYLLSDDENVSGFASRYLEDFVSALSELRKEEWVSELKLRYLG